MKKKVLFLCTGNSCRSQMAEGLLRHYFGDKFEVFSAGVNPTEVNRNAIQAMANIGIDISQQKSKSVSEYIEQAFDIIITVCDNAKESCPVFHGNAKRLYWSFFDPAEAVENIDETFEKVRDQIKDKIQSYFGEGEMQ